MCSGQDTPLMQVGLSEPAKGPTAQAISPVSTLSLPSLHNTPEH